MSIQDKDKLNEICKMQEKFLQNIQNETIHISVFLINGIQLRGTLKDSDDYVLCLVNNNIPQLVYKHAISTIIPYDNFNKNTRNEKVNFSYKNADHNSNIDFSSNNENQFVFED